MNNDVHLFLGQVQGLHNLFHQKSSLQFRGTGEKQNEAIFLKIKID